MRRRLAANVGFNSIEFGDLAQRFRRDRRIGCLRDLVELAPCMAPTCRENDVSVLGELLEAGISIDMEHAFEVRKMRNRPLGLAIRRKQINCRPWLRSTPGGCSRA